MSTSNRRQRRAKTNRASEPLHTMATSATPVLRFGLAESISVITAAVTLSLGAVYASMAAEGVIQMTLLAVAWLLVAPLVFLFSGWPFMKRAAIIALYGIALAAFGYFEFKTAHAATNPAVTQNVSGQHNGPITGNMTNNGTINNNFAQMQDFDKPSNSVPSSGFAAIKILGAGEVDLNNMDIDGFATCIDANHVGTLKASNSNCRSK